MDISDVTWHCVICANANHSSIAYDLHGLSLTQHNITATADLSLDTNSDSPFHPYRTSTQSRASKQDKHARRPLHFLSVNCQSIVDKVAEFDNLIHTLRPDVILGMESWLTPSHTCEGGGGVFIAVSEDLNSLEMPELTTDCEILWVKVKLQGRRTLLVCCFYHPHTEASYSMKAFAESAHRVSNINNAKIVAGGYFNLPGWHWQPRP